MLLYLFSRSKFRKRRIQMIDDNHLGTGPYRDRVTLEFKRKLSIPNGLAEFSQPTDFAAILVERPGSSPQAIAFCQ